MPRLPNVWREFTDGQALRSQWLDFKRDALSSLESFSPELPPGTMEKTGGRRVWLFARAMFLRLTPARRIVFLAAIALSITYLFADAQEPFAADRLLLAIACLVGLLALELADRVALKRDLEVARDIQTCLLPHSPPQLPFLDIAFTTRPANTVAGDYYDILSLPSAIGPSILFVVADVAGKGIPAGLLMAGFRACLHTLANTFHDVRNLTVHLRDFCYANSYGGRRFTTAFLALYQPGTRLLEYVNAGQNPPLLRRATGGIEQLETGGMPFGALPGAAYDIGQISIGAGDSILMYTDGVVEAENETAEEFGMDRLIAFTRNKRDSAVEYQRQLMASIDAFTSRAPQHDDITCMVVQFT